MNERRLLPRQRSFMQGRVFFNHRRSSVDCLVRDFNETGARLHFADLVTLPDHLELFIPSKDETFQADVMWHNGNDIGVSLVAADAPKLQPESFRSADPLHDRVTKLEHEVAVLRKRMDASQN